MTNGPDDVGTQDGLIGAVCSVLQNSRGMPVAHIQAHLRKRGISATVPQLSRLLRANRDTFQTVGPAGSTWMLTPLRSQPARAKRTFVDRIPALRPWQTAALEAWAGAGNRGIVQAITGAGKSLVAVSAIRDALADGLTCLVIVPTTPLIAQWEHVLVTSLPGIRVARQGGGAGAQWATTSADVIVSTVQTAARRPFEPGQAESMLLVADEAHHYAATTFRGVLREPFAQRLGLTATLQRQDGADLSFLVPSLGSIVYELTYAQALAAQVVAPFDVVLFGVDLDPKERADYVALATKLDGLAASIQGLLPQRHTADELHGQIVSLAGRGGDGAEAARDYVAAFAELQDLLDSFPARMDALAALKPDIDASHGTLIFTQSIELARAAARRLNALGVSNTTLTSEHSHEERQAALSRFAAGSLQAVIAPQLLDEGIDVPDANLAIVLSASRTRRQMVQRMGRVIRPKQDGGAAQFAIIFGSDTREDPSHGAHSSFLEEVLPLARSVTRFGEKSG